MVEQAACVVSMIEATGFNWLGRWNAENVNSLVHCDKDGRPGKLDSVQREKF